MLNNGRYVQNASFLKLIIKNIKDTNCIEEIGDAIENYEKNNPYWKNFGMKYFSCISLCSNDDVVGYINNSKFTKNIILVRLKNVFFESQIEDNQNIVNLFLEGIEEGKRIFDRYSKEIVDAIAKSSLEYLSEHISTYDKCNMYEAKIVYYCEENEFVVPLSANETYKFGMVYPWPGINTAETELLARTKRAAENIGFECVQLSNFGKILDDEQLETDVLVAGDSLEYVMTTHYESPKTIDGYYYHLLWNPPEIPLNTGYYEERVIDNYIMNEDYLIYDSGGMSNHLRSILLSKPRNIDNASTFVGSFPRSAVLKPNLSDPKIFYCGMNWEKAQGNDNRHAGLFKMLDDTGKVKFYGPEKMKEWGGIRPWEGYKCYQYSIPFDGFSILNEINSCGICLAISSDVHRRAGAVTNRAYEACAAGAVIISDNNVFMEEYFKDSVLYITYNKENPKDTFDQIMEKYQWIVEHREESIEMAKKSQQIFVEKFCMEKGILDVTNNHFSRFKTIEKDLFAKDNSQRVLVTKVLNTLDINEIKNKLDRTVLNVEKQYYRNIILAIICDYKIENSLKTICEEYLCNINVIPLSLFDEKESRNITDGKAIRYAQKMIPHDYYINMDSTEEWFRDHITTLIRTLEDEPEALAACSGLLTQDKKKYRREYMFQNITKSILYNQNPKTTFVSGQFIFRSKAHSFVPDYVFDYLDGCEHNMYLVLLMFKYQMKTVFSKRMTCIWNTEEISEAYSILDRNRQIRFIRGTIKYNIEPSELGNNEGSADKQLLVKLGEHFPIAYWVELRLAYFSYKIFKSKRMKNKYLDKVDKFNKYIMTL